MAGLAAPTVLQFAENEEFRLTEGRILKIEGGEVYVSVGTASNDSQDSQIHAARVLSTLDLSPDRHVGSSVFIAVSASSAVAPVILGIIEDRIAAEEGGKGKTVNLVLEANESISLRCGAGEIVIRRSGEVTIRGTKIVSRSAGPNKIRGATVSIN